MYLVQCGGINGIWMGTRHGMGCFWFQAVLDICQSAPPTVRRPRRSTVNELTTDNDSLTLTLTLTVTDNEQERTGGSGRRTCRRADRILCPAPWRWDAAPSACWQWRAHAPPLIPQYTAAALSQYAAALRPGAPATLEQQDIYSAEAPKACVERGQLLLRTT